MYSSANFCHHIPLDFCPLRNWHLTTTPFIFITMTGTVLTVIRERIIFPVSCMMLPIEVLKTLIHGQTLWKLKVATCRITTCPRFTECSSLEESASSSKSVNAINRLDSIMRLISANILRSSGYIGRRIDSLCSGVNIPCAFT